MRKIRWFQSVSALELQRLLWSSGYIYENWLLYDLVPHCLWVWVKQLKLTPHMRQAVFPLLAGWMVHTRSIFVHFLVSFAALEVSKIILKNQNISAENSTYMIKHSDCGLLSLSFHQHKQALLMKAKVYVYF